VLVSKTERYPFDGDVYNLTVADDESYVANGLIAHNCRCHAQTVDQQELERNNWTVETEDPTGGLFEPVTPDGVTMPARPLMPDRGWGGQPKRLEKIFDDSLAAETGAIWKETPGQPGPKELGRPTRQQISAAAWMPALPKTRTPEELMAEGMTRSEAMAAIETKFRSVMGISPKETMSVLRGPDGGAVTVSLFGLAHAMLKRDQARERYMYYFRDVIERPWEVLFTEYQASKATKFRKKYIGLYASDQKRQGVVIVAEETPQGWIIWNVMQVDRKKIDRQRRGKKVLWPDSQAG